MTFLLIQVKKSECVRDITKPIFLLPTQHVQVNKIHLYKYPTN